MRKTHRNWRIILILTLFTTLFCINISSSYATGPLQQEYDYQWTRTYLGNEVDKYVYDLCVADVDGDGVNEIITVGTIGSDPSLGHLTILTWDGATLTHEFEKFISYTDLMTYLWSVDVGDINGDGVLEIVIVGAVIEVDPPWSERALLSVYTWDDTTLTLLDSIMQHGQEGQRNFFASVDVADIDADGIDEIVISGSHYRDGFYSFVSVFVAGSLHQEAVHEFAHGDVLYASLSSVKAGVIDDTMRIVAGGGWIQEDNPAYRYWTQLHVLSYGSELTVEVSEEWSDDEGSYIGDVFIANDKIYTIGMVETSERQFSQLRVWRYGSLVLDESVDFGGAFENAVATDVFVADIDGDDVDEIVTGSRVFDGVNDNAHFIVWEQESPITFRDVAYWAATHGARLHAVYVADVDNDGVNEILTAGEADRVNWNWINFQVTIWSYPDADDPTISDLTPADGSTVETTKPEISTTFNDDYSGIDPTTVSIRLEQTYVTGDATISETGFTYTPSDDLSDGDYTVRVTVKDQSGNSKSVTWTFAVKAPAMIPGFPIEGILLGLLSATLILFTLRKKENLPPP